MPCCAIAAFIAAQVLAFSRRVSARVFGVIPAWAQRALPPIPKSLMVIVLAGELAFCGTWLIAHQQAQARTSPDAAFCLAGPR